MKWIRFSDQFPPIGEFVLFWFKDSVHPQNMDFATRVNEKEFSIHVPYSKEKKHSILFDDSICELYSHWCHIEGPK